MPVMLAGRLVVSPAEFSNEYATVAVLASRTPTPSLSATISDDIADEPHMRRYLGDIQDTILRDYAIWVELADISAAEVEKKRAKTYVPLVRWVGITVRKNGRQATASAYAALLEEAEVGNGEA